MIPFSQMLRKFIDAKGHTINEVSRYTGIDHSTLYKFISGTRTPSGIDTVNRIAEYLRLSVKEADDLRGSYYFSTQGEVHYYGAQQILELMARLSDDVPRELPVEKNAFPVQNTEQVLHGQKQINETFLSLCLEAGNRGDKKLLVFSTGNDPALFTALARVCITCRDLSVKHLQVLDNSGQVGTDYRIFNIGLLNNVMPMVLRCPRYSVRGIYADISTLESLRSVPMQILWTEQGALVYALDWSNGFLVRDAEKVLALYDSLVRLSRGAREFVYRTTTEEMLAVNRTIASTCRNTCGQNDKTYFFDAGMCCVLILDEKETFAEKHLNMDEPARSAFIDALHGYLPVQKAYLRSVAGRTKILCAVQGITNFCETGYINEINPDVMTPLSVEERIAAMVKWKEAYEKGFFTMVDIQHLKPTCCTMIQASPTFAVFEIAGEGGSYMTAEVKEPGIVSLIYWFCEYAATEFALTRDKGIAYLDECIQRLREHGDH